MWILQFVTVFIFSFSLYLAYKKNNLMNKLLFWIIFLNESGLNDLFLKWQMCVLTLSVCVVESVS